jgi:hypothetical protein
MANPTPSGRSWLPVAALVAALLVSALIPSVSAAALRKVAPQGADSGSCAASACASVAYATERADSGDVIELASGDYGAQQVTESGVELRAAKGASAAVQEIDVKSSNVTLRDLTASNIDIAGSGPINNVTLINMSANHMYMRDVHDVSVLGGSFGANQDEPTVLIDGQPASTGITFDGVDFHDAVATNSTVHMECIWAGGVQNFTVRNSIFRNCAYFDIFFTKLNGPDPKDVLLENNVFESPKQWNGQDAPYAINIANWLSKVENFTIRNNTFDGDMTIQPSSVSNVVVAGNLGMQGSCKSGVQYVRNVWSRIRCGSTDKVASNWASQVVDPGGHDWRLRPGATAIDASDASISPARDREGKARVGAPDAGAHEFGDAPATPTSPSSPSEGSGAVFGFAATSLTRRRICRNPSRHCKRKTTLRVRLTGAGRVTVKLRRKGRLVRRMVRQADDGAVRFRLNARKLKRGRYVVRVAAKDGAGATAVPRRLRLRVR